MATDGRISSMIRDLEPDESNIFETSKPSGGSTSGYITRAVSLNGIANAVLNEMEYTTDLETEAKQVIPAINELYTKGGKSSVLFVPQKLTEAQKVQARQNIGASGGSDVTMQDNTKGGVDLNVGGVTRTLINKSDVTFAENKSGGVDLSVYNTSATLAKQSDLDDLRAEINNKTLRFVDQQEEGMNTPPEGALIESLLTVDGKSEQKTFKGYNILPPAVAGKTTSVRGVTLESDGKGGFIASGTATSSGVIWFKLTKPFIIPTSVGGGGSGVVYLFNSMAWESGIVIRFRKDSTEILSLNLSATNRVTSTWTSGFGETVDEIGLYCKPDISLDGLTFKPMFVVDGIEDHEFEPFVGGIPSPSPDYPQDMGGYVEELNFKVTGRNQWNEHWENGYFNTDGSQGSSTVRIRSSDYIRVKPNSTYFFCHPYAGHLRVIFYDVNKNFLTSGYARSNETVTMGSDVYYIKFCTQTADNVTEYMGNICINISDVKNGIYEPYHEEHRTITPPFPLKKIRGTSDYCDVTQGEWVRYFDLRRLSAEENWTSHAISGSDTKRYKYTVLDLKQFQTALPDIMSNYFTAITSLEDQTGDYLGIYIGNYAVEVCVTQQTVEEFKQWLEETEVYLLAPLIKPVTEPIETEDLFYLRILQNLPAENILTITDQNSEDCSYLMKYLIQRGATT